MTEGDSNRSIELSRGTADLLKKFATTLENFATLTLSEKRVSLDTIYLTDKPKTSVDVVLDDTISSNELTIPVRIYHMNSTNQLLPVLVYFHGGGWVLGSLDSQDALCRLVASLFECVVISVDYRLAPEHQYPAAVDDCLGVLEWISSKASHNWDIEKIVLAGDSAGGNIAAVVSKICRENKLPGKIIHQVLIYPVTDLSHFDTSSYEKYATGYSLNKKEMIWFRNLYLGDEVESTNPRVSPLLETDFRECVRTTVITAGFDVLHDEGAAFYQKLRDHGVVTELVNFQNLTHSFLRFTEHDENARKAVNQIVDIIGSSWIKNSE